MTAGGLLNNLDMNGLLVKNLGNPVDANDAITKGYVDVFLEGNKWKAEEIRVVAQSNVNIASPGANVDGIAMNQGDRILLRLQTASAENGIWVFDTATTPLVRSLDANIFEEVIAATVTISEGTAANQSYRQTEISGTIDVDPQFWIQFGTATPDATETIAGKARVGSQPEVDAGLLDNVFITPKKLNSFASSQLVKKQTYNVGNNTDNVFVINHTLDTKSLVSNAYFNSTDEKVAWVKIDPLTTTAVTVTTAPGYILSNDEIRIVLIG